MNNFEKLDALDQWLPLALAEKLSNKLTSKEVNTLVAAFKDVAKRSVKYVLYNIDLKRYVGNDGMPVANILRAVRGTESEMMNIRDKIKVNQHHYAIKEFK